MSVLSLLAATNYNYYSNSPEDIGGAIAILIVYTVIGIVAYLISSFLFYKVFKKAGRPGWAAFIPVYNYWILFEMAGKPGWWALLIIPSIIPFVGLLFSLAFLVLTLLMTLELAKRFGKSQVFAIFGLWLFSIVGYAILAFDDSKYHGPDTSAAAPSPHPATASPSQNPPTPSSLVQ
jgi:hypothetical protein